MISLAIAVGLAVALLAAVIWSGATHRRQLHYALVAAFFASLVAAVWRAELVGRGLIFEGTAATIHHVHDGVVALDVLLALALLVTGVRLARAPAPLAPLRRRFHRSLATLFAVSVLVSAALGTAMTLLARPVG